MMASDSSCGSSGVRVARAYWDGTANTTMGALRSAVAASPVTVTRAGIETPGR